MVSNPMDFVEIVEMLEFIIQYPIPVFGFYITLESVCIFTESVGLALEATYEVFQ